MKLCIFSFVFLALASAISAAVLGTVGKRTFGDVQGCFQAKQKSCRQQCSEWLPENVTESENCLHNLRKQRMSAFKQCLTDAGLSETLPCVAFNRSRYECKEEVTAGNLTEAQRRDSSSSESSEEKGEGKQGKSSSSEDSTVESGEKVQLGEAEQKRDAKIQAVFESMAGFHDCLFTCMDQTRDICTEGCDAADGVAHKAFETCRRHHHGGKGKHHGGHHGGRKHHCHHHGHRHHGGGRHHHGRHGHHHHRHGKDAEFLMCFS